MKKKEPRKEDRTEIQEMKSTIYEEDKEDEEEKIGKEAEKEEEDYDQQQSGRNEEREKRLIAESRIGGGLGK